MGGSIDVTSEVGNGTTIWVNLPCEMISSEKKKELI
jgi:signal transduction histidine kinase